MIKDPIVEGVRGIRDKLAADYHYDIHAIFESLRISQREYGSRIVNRLNSGSEQIGRTNSESAPFHSAPSE